MIAIVGGEGAVVTGGSNSDSLFSDPPAFASDIVARAILDAANNDNVAIVFPRRQPRRIADRVRSDLARR